MVLLCFIMQKFGLGSIGRIAVLMNSLRKRKVSFMSGLFCPTGQIVVQTSAHCLLNLSCVSTWKKRPFIFPGKYISLTMVYAIRCRPTTLNWTSKTSIQSLTEILIPPPLLPCHGCLVSSVHELTVSQQLNWDSCWCKCNFDTAIHFFISFSSFLPLYCLVFLLLSDLAYTM